MCQQTRIDTVIPYYHRFMETFPTVSDLASADEAVLLKVWQGLGYYSRARNLKKAAIVIQQQYQGVFPKDYEAVRRLPGIGDYTASAILSMAYDQKYASVDGNFLRVFPDCGVTDPIFRYLPPKSLSKANRGNLTAT